MDVEEELLLAPSSSASNPNNLRNNKESYNNTKETEAIVKPIQLAKIFDGKFFTFISCNNKNIIVSCVLCKPQDVKVRGHGSSSTNFISHLRRIHGESTAREYQKYAQEKNGERKRFLNENKKKVLPYIDTEKTELVVKFIVDAMVPLKTLENEYFQELLRRINFPPVSRRTLGRRITEYFNRNEEMLRTICRTIPYFCITCDIWAENRSFLVVAINWLSETFERKSLLLACRRFCSNYTPEQIADLLINILIEYEIQEKVIATLTHNISEFSRVFHLYRVNPGNIQLESNGGNLIVNELGDDSFDNEEEIGENLTPEICSLIPKHIKSASHILRLCITNSIKLIQNCNELSAIHYSALKKCNRLWSLASHPKTCEVVENILQRTLSQPEDTQWSSLYNSMQEIISIEDKIVELQNALNIEDLLTNQELEYIKEHVACTKPLAELLQILQGEENLFYGILLPSILSLDRKLNILSDCKWMYCIQLVAALRTSVRNSFSDFFQFTSPETLHAAIATFAYPRFKCSWLNIVDPIHHKKLLTQFKEVVSNYAEKNVLAVSSSPAPEDEFFDFGVPSETVNISLHTLNSELEIQRYFDDPSRQVQSLDRYPYIRQVFLKYNTPLPSSAPVEKLFCSSAWTDLHFNLSDKMFEQKVVMKANMSYLDETLNPFE